MSDNPFVKRLAKSSPGTRAEKATAKRIGARLTPASGARDHSKGDMATRKFRIENKSTKKNSLSIQLDWLLKIRQESLETGQTPALTFQFTQGNGDTVRNGAWAVVPEYVFAELLAFYEENRN